MARTPPPPAFDASTGLLHVVAAADVPDADDEVVVPSTLRLDHYRANPVVIFGHDQQRLPVATCARVELRGDELHQWWRFADTREAKDVEKLYRAGILKGASVGFKSDGVRRISAEEAFRRYGVRRPLKVHLGGDLKETSAVPVPCNPAALAVRWEPGPALKVAAAGALDGDRLSPLVTKALRSLARQAHAGRTMPRPHRSLPVSATADTTTKAMDTMDDTAGGSMTAMAADAPEPAADAGHEAEITTAMETAGMAVLRAFFKGELDDKAMLGKIKTIARTHGDLTDTAAAEEPADEPEESDGDEYAEDDTGEYEPADDGEDDLEEKAVGDRSANQDGQRAAMYAKDPEMEAHMERHGVKPRKKRKFADRLTTKAVDTLAAAVEDLQAWRDRMEDAVGRLQAGHATQTDILAALAGVDG